MVLDHGCATDIFPLLGFASTFPIFLRVTLLLMTISGVQLGHHVAPLLPSCAGAVLLKELFSPTSLPLISRPSTGLRFAVHVNGP